MAFNLLKRREFVRLIGGAAAASWPCIVATQEPGRMYRLAGLSPNPREASNFVAMFEELRRSGSMRRRLRTLPHSTYWRRLFSSPIAR
jgi:hypothetical protein